VAVFKHKYSTGSAVTCLSCGGVFNESTVHKAVSANQAHSEFTAMYIKFHDDWVQINY